MDKDYIVLKKEGKIKTGWAIYPPPPPKSIIIIGDNPGIQVAVNKKFNWFQKKMIKWCFGFKVKENK